MLKQTLILAFLLGSSLQAFASVPRVDTNFLTGPGFDDKVADMVRQPDGKLITVGYFRYAVGVGSQYILRLNADGTVDSTFDAGRGANFPILAVRLQPDGKILIAGGFTQFNGVSINRIARLNADGSLDHSFNPNGGADRTVYSLAVQPDGKILAAGDFTLFGGATVDQIVRLNENGTLDPAFTATSEIGLGGEIRCVEVQANGKILIGGSFVMPNFNSGIARLNVDGSWDQSLFTNTNGEVLAIRETAVGIYIAGTFGIVNLNGRRGVARITASGATDTTFMANGTNSISSIAIQPDGKVIAGGFTFGMNNLRRINPDGVIDTTFAANELEEIYAVVLEPSGDVVAGGRFGVSNGFGGARPAGAIRVKPNGARDPNFITQHGAMDLEVEQFALQPDGKILIYGGFASVGNTAVQRFARLNTDGSLDRTFTPAFNEFSTMAVQPDGKIIVGGYRFDMRGTIPIRRLNVDGTIDPTFTASSTTDTGALADIKAIFVEPDGKVIVGGGFYEINGVPKKGIARLKPDGSIDNTFQLGIVYNSATIYKILRRPSGKLYIAGRFVNGSGFAHAIFRFTPDGTPEVQTLLNSQFPGSFLVNDIAFQEDGKMLIAGPFNLVGNTAIKGVARVNEDGFPDTSFIPPAVVTVFGDPGSINAALPRRDGKVLIGGGFATIGGVSQSGLALLNSDGSLDPSLTFTLTSNGGGGGGTATGFLRQPDGKILVKGAFNHFNSVTRCCASRLVDGLRTVGYDYDGDGRSDISVFRPATGAWYLQRSTAGYFGTGFGTAEDRIVPADYDGDGKTDIAVYRPSTGIWYVTNSSNGAVTYNVFGIAEDLPTPADYDGDGKADISVFRPSTGTWYRQNSSDGAFVAAQFGATGDKPTVGDFDGDGKADIAVFRPSTGAWYQTWSSNGFLFGEQFGISTDKITQADYDGDGKTDIAIYRPSEGLWYVKRSATTTYVPYVFGLAADIPTPGDFDGDGKADIGVFRPSDGTWYIVNSSNGSYTIYQFGQNGDQPTLSGLSY